MGLPDKHDARRFKSFVKIAADGTVVGVVEVHETQPDPRDHEDSLFLDVTDLLPADVHVVTIDPKHVKAIATAKARAAAAFREAVTRGEQR